MRWLIRKLFGSMFFISYTKELKDDEILIIGHRVYLPIKMKGERSKK